MALTYGTDLVLRSQRYMRDPTRGKRAVFTWEGTQEQISVLALTMGQNVTWETDDSDSPKWRLIAQTPDDTDLQTVWEVHGNDMHKSLYEHSRSTTAVSDADLTKIRNYMKGPEDAIPPSISAGTLHSVDAEELLYLMRHQQDSYFLPRYMLRSRMIGSIAGFPAPVTYPSGAGLVFEQSLILTGGKYDMLIAPGVQDFMRDIPPETDPSGNSTWGWLMKSPSISSMPAGKYEYRQEFWLGLWSNYTYDAAV